MRLKLQANKLLVAVLISIMIVPVFTDTAFADVVKPIADSQRYARTQLKNMNGGSRLLKAYNSIQKSLKDGKPKINLSEYNLSAKEFQKVYFGVIGDYPEMFWVKNQISWTSMGHHVVNCTPSYSIRRDKLKNAKNKYNAKVKSIVGEINSSMSDYEKEIYIHDKIAEMVVYDRTAKNAHDAYGALVGGRAVCEGYSKAFQHLLNECGIQSFGVIGFGSGEDHMWNIVKLGKEWYHVDLTWNDSEKYTFHSYFNLTTKQIKADHVIRNNNFKIPISNGGAYSRERYFEDRQSYLDTYDREKIAQALINGGGNVSLLVGDGIEVSDFIKMIYGELSYYGEQLGLHGSYSVSCLYVGKEITVTLQ